MNNPLHPIPTRSAMTDRLLGEGRTLCGIYVITNKNTGLRYVGQSRNIRRRWAEHLSGQGNCPKLAASIKKHGPGAFTFEIVELCAPEALNDRELFYISAFGFDSRSPKGYNLGAGGEGVDFTPEVRAKMSEVRRNSEAVQAVRGSPEYRAKLSQSRKDSIGSPEARAKLSESLKNSEALKAARASPEVRTKMLEALKAANRARADQHEYVLIHVKTGAVERGKQYELRDRLGLHPGNLCDLLKGRKYKTHKGYRLAHPDELPEHTTTGTPS